VRVLVNQLAVYLSVDANSTSQHGNYTDTVLPDHLPEVADGVQQRRLCRYVPELLSTHFHLLTTARCYVNRVP